MGCSRSTRIRRCLPAQELLHAPSSGSAPAPPSRIQYFHPHRHTPRSARGPTPAASLHEIVSNFSLFPTSCSCLTTRHAPALSIASRTLCRLRSATPAHDASLQDACARLGRLSL